MNNPLVSSDPLVDTVGKIQQKTNDTIAAVKDRVGAVTNQLVDEAAIIKSTVEGKVNTMGNTAQDTLNKRI